jgi:hypothetical protein
VVPGTAADHPHSHISRITRCSCVYLIILRPFPDVAVHLIEAPLVGLEAVDWDRLPPVAWLAPL